jgi:hypothetical protein
MGGVGGGVVVVMGGVGGCVCAKSSGTKGRKAVELSQKPRGALNRVRLVYAALLLKMCPKNV